MKNGSEVDKYGNKYWYKNNKYHRKDGPAAEYANGSKFWYINNKCHREDGAALECENGDKYWYKNDNLHREDGPAIEKNNGTCFGYYLDGKQLNFPNNIRLTKEKMELYITFM